MPKTPKQLIDYVVDHPGTPLDELAAKFGMPSDALGKLLSKKKYWGALRVDQAGCVHPLLDDHEKLYEAARKENVDIDGELEAPV